mmetsp:Transcript_8488/g.16984  ORF Transcript_8488/g.16984 Transcript_8488/m.16984 type:complete len:205 (+) Transcript_8488:195-809(+)
MLSSSSRSSVWQCIASSANSAHARSLYVTNAIALLGISRSCSTSPHSEKWRRRDLWVASAPRSIFRPPMYSVLFIRLKLPVPRMSSRSVPCRGRPKQSLRGPKRFSSSSVGMRWRKVHSLPWKQHPRAKNRQQYAASPNLSSVFVLPASRRMEHLCCAAMSSLFSFHCSPSHLPYQILNSLHPSGAWRFEVGGSSTCLRAGRLE